MEDFVTWVDTSKLKRTVMRYNDEVSVVRMVRSARLISSLFFSWTTSTCFKRGLSRILLLQPQARLLVLRAFLSHEAVSRIPHPLDHAHAYGMHVVVARGAHRVREFVVIDHKRGRDLESIGSHYRPRATNIGVHEGAVVCDD